MSSPWSVQDAKAQLSEVLRRARAGEPQRIGTREACVVISESDWRALQGERLGAWLVKSAPRLAELSLPTRESTRDVPFADLGPDAL